MVSKILFFAQYTRHFSLVNHKHGGGFHRRRAADAFREPVAQAGFSQEISSFQNSDHAFLAVFVHGRDFHRPRLDVKADEQDSPCE